MYIIIVQLGNIFNNALQFSFIVINLIFKKNDFIITCYFKMYEVYIFYTFSNKHNIHKLGLIVLKTDRIY